MWTDPVGTLLTMLPATSRALASRDLAVEAPQFARHGGERVADAGEPDPEMFLRREATLPTDS